jgi:hypothetical protein
MSERGLDWLEEVHEKNVLSFKRQRRLDLWLSALIVVSTLCCCYSAVNCIVKNFTVGFVILVVIIFMDVANLLFTIWRMLRYHRVMKDESKWYEKSKQSWLALERVMTSDLDDDEEVEKFMEAIDLLSGK